MRFNVKITALAVAGAIALFAGPAASAKEDSKTVTVNPGDTLTAIADANGTTYVRIFDANEQIANPDVIDAGLQVRIPKADEELPDRFGAMQAQVAAAVAAQQAAYVAPAQNYSYAQQAATYTQPASAAPAQAPADGSVWDTIAQCESGGNWSINTGNGYSGGLQFSPGTWAKYGDGSASAAQASRDAQIAAAEKVQAAQGWGAWPACSAKAGLR